MEENLQNEDSSSAKFLEGESGEKVLSTVWNNAKDTFTFKVKANELPVSAEENSNELKLKFLAK